MGNRCINDIFGYCSGVPMFDAEPSGDEHVYAHGGHCKHNPKKCKKYMTSLQDFRRMADEVKAKVENWPEHSSVVQLVKTLEEKEAIAGN